MIFPGLSDRETLTRYRGLAPTSAPDRERPGQSLRESAEVSWLLGCQFHVGVVPGVAGAAAGRRGAGVGRPPRGPARSTTPGRSGSESGPTWSSPGSARPGRPTPIEDLAEGLATAARLVRRGGKIVALSRAEGPIGPALRRIAGAEDPGAALGRAPRPRGRPRLPGRPPARRGPGLGRRLPAQRARPRPVEDLGDDPARPPRGGPQARRRPPPALFLSQADRTRALVDGRGLTGESDRFSHIDSAIS